MRTAHIVRSPFKVLLLVSFTIVCAGVIITSSAQPCGGILEGDSGTAKFESAQVTSLNPCIWIIKLLTTSNLLFKLKSINSGSTLNLYSEHAPTSLTIDPITLNSSNVGQSAFRVIGQTVVLILTQNLDMMTDDAPFSFSWDSAAQENHKVSPSMPISSVNYLDTNEGLVSWTNFKIRHRSLLVLNTDHSMQPSFGVEVKGQLEPCTLPDPCRCSYLGTYEVLADGQLREVYRQCGQPFEFNRTGLLPTILAIVHINPSICLALADTSDQTSSAPVDTIDSASNFLEFTWTMGSPEDMTTTTLAPTTTTSTTTPKPNPFICPDSSVIAPCMCSTGARITCIGPQVTQDHIDGAIAAVRQANGVSGSQVLFMTFFQVSQTNLLQLNLDAFVNNKFDWLDIISNRKIASLYLSSVDRKLDVRYFQASTNALTEAGIPDLSEMFRVETMTDLSLAHNMIKGLQPGDSTSGEYLRGLSSLTALRTINLYNTDPPKMHGGQFRRNRNLTSIYLAYCERDGTWTGCLCT